MNIARQNYGLLLATVSSLVFSTLVSPPAFAVGDSGTTTIANGEISSWSPPEQNSLYQVSVTAYGGLGGNGAPDGPGSFGEPGPIGFIEVSFIADSAVEIFPGGNGGNGFKSGSELGLSTGAGTAGVSTYAARFNGGLGGNAGLSGWSGGGGGGGAATVISYAGDVAVAAGGAGGGGGANCAGSGGDGASSFVANAAAGNTGADGKRPSRDGGGSGAGGGGYVGGQAGDFSNCGGGSTGEPWGQGGFPGSNGSDFGTVENSGYTTNTSMAGKVLVTWNLISGPGIRAPRSLSMTSRDYTTLDVSWTAPASTDLSLIDGYVVEWSNDEGRTWSNSSLVNATSYRIAGLNSGSAYLIRVAAKDGSDQGPYSAQLFATTRGLKSSVLTITDASGDPVTGGAVTWELNDGTAWSSKTYGLTDTGQIVFPATAAGSATVSLEDGITADGSRVSGEWEIILGYSGLEVALPDAPAATKTIIVSMPNGQPIGGVEIDWADQPQSEIDVDGFRFVSSEVSLPTTTDSFGVAVAHGFFDVDPEVTLTYVDSIVSQRQWVTLENDVTSAELEYSPWVEALDTSVTTSSDSSAEVEVQVALPDGFRARESSTTVSKVAPGLSGISVSLVGSAKTPKKCADGTKPKMTGESDSNGIVKFRICPSSTTTFRLTSADVVASGAVDVLVSKSAPTGVTNLTTRSSAKGELVVTWGTPTFNGGAALKKYSVTLKKVGSKKSSTTTVNGRSVQFKNLANASDYVVTVKATNKFGSSDARSCLVGVV